jgi:hypothetical protein
MKIITIQQIRSGISAPTTDSPLLIGDAAVQMFDSPHGSVDTCWILAKVEAETRGQTHGARVRAAREAVRERTTSVHRIG